MHANKEQLIEADEEFAVDLSTMMVKGNLNKSFDSTSVSGSSENTQKSEQQTAPQRSMN